MKHKDNSVKVPLRPQYHAKTNGTIAEFFLIKDDDPEHACEIIKEVANCGNLDAKLEYGRFLRTTPNLRIEQATRYREAEQVLLEINNLMDLPRRFSVMVALELATLYAECLHRPIAALGMFLYAKRLGGIVDERQLDNLNRKLLKSDISRLGDNYRDALLLGQELQHAGGVPRLTEFFLREAVDGAYTAIGCKEKGAHLVYAQAALALGDYYDSHLEESPVFRNERDILYAAAREYGYPEYLSKTKV